MENIDVGIVSRNRESGLDFRKSKYRDEENYHRLVAEGRFFIEMKKKGMIKAEKDRCVHV